MPAQAAQIGPTCVPASGNARKRGVSPRLHSSPTCRGNIPTHPPEQVSQNRQIRSFICSTVRVVLNGRDIRPRTVSPTVCQTREGPAVGWTDVGFRWHPTRPHCRWKSAGAGFAGDPLRPPVSHRVLRCAPRLGTATSAYGTGHGNRCPATTTATPAATLNRRTSQSLTCPRPGWRRLLPPQSGETARGIQNGFPQLLRFFRWRSCMTVWEFNTMMVQHNACGRPSTVECAREQSRDETRQGLRLL